VTGVGKNLNGKEGIFMRGIIAAGRVWGKPMQKGTDFKA